MPLKVMTSGKPVLQLVPIKKIIAFSPMSPDERKELSNVNQHYLEMQAAKAKAKREARKARKARQKANKKLESGDIKWRNFLLDQKNATFHKELFDLRQMEIAQDLKEGELLNKLIKEWNESNIQQKASTRMLKVDQILEHYWTGNPKPPVFLEDGSINQTAQVPDPLPSDLPRKFLIYVAYRSHRNLLGKMFDIKKRGYVYYDGSMLPSKRQKAVDQFNSDPNICIMIISNVGSAGLNLTAASVVITASHVWSGQEKCQITGRAHRFGQARDVVVFDIVAPDGIDLALLGYSDSKTCLSDRFLMSHKKLKEAYLQVTEATDDEDNEDEGEQETYHGTTKSKVPARKRKQPDMDEQDDQQDKAPQSGSPSKRTKTSGSSRGPTSQPDTDPSRRPKKSTSKFTKKVQASGQEHLGATAMADSRPTDDVVLASRKEETLAGRSQAVPKIGGSQRLQDTLPASTSSSEPTKRNRIRPKPKGAPPVTTERPLTVTDTPERPKESFQTETFPKPSVVGKTDAPPRTAPAVTVTDGAGNGSTSRPKALSSTTAGSYLAGNPLPLAPSRLSDASGSNQRPKASGSYTAGDPLPSPPHSAFTFEISESSQGSDRSSSQRRTGFVVPSRRVPVSLESQPTVASGSRSDSGGLHSILKPQGKQPQPSRTSGAQAGKTPTPVARTPMVPQPAQCINNSAFQKRTGFCPPGKKPQGPSAGSSAARGMQPTDIESLNVLDVGERPTKVARLAVTINSKSREKHNEEE